jgi:hypothetical protein
MNSQPGHETSVAQGRTATSPDGDKTGEWLHRPGVAEYTTSENDPIVIGLRNSAPALSSFRRAMISFASNVKAKIPPNQHNL